ncbi:MAG: LysE family transporter [Eubacteriales bacterium]|nr:LysE family transporter [Eubacteriales bacterium]
MTAYLFKGVLIGLLFGLPVGAVGAMTVQRTWAFGLKAGLLTGLGSSVADCLYAIVGAFGMTMVSDFLLRYQTIIHLLGGSLILLIGLRLIVKKEEQVAAEPQAKHGAKLFLSSFAIGVTNPAAILTFLFAFSYFGVTGIAKPVDRLGLVCGVLIGTYLWWTTLAAATHTLRKKAKASGFPRMNKVFGAFLTAFGAVIFLRTLVPS